MKKFFASLVVAALASVTAFAAEGFAYGVWFNSPKETAKTNIEGVGLGIPVIQCGNLDGVSLALCGNVSKKTSGFEFALIGFNNADSLDGAQVAFVNLHDGVSGDFGFQLGCYNQSGKQGVQVGLINNSRDNGTFQLGLVNINKNGFFPVMILVNFSKALVD